MSSIHSQLSLSKNSCQTNTVLIQNLHRHQISFKDLFLRTLKLLKQKKIHRSGFFILF
jgi:hypothetical protein